MAKHSQRRYKAGLNKIYDDAYDRLRLNSELLNGGSMMPNIHTTFFDKEGLLGAKLELEGNEEGKYLRSGEYRMASIPMVEDKLQTIEERFEIHKEQMREQGYRVSDSYPKQLNDERLLTEAKLDVLKEELDEINRRLETYIDKEEAKSAGMVLVHGLQCFGKLRDGKLESIDGQNVKNIVGVMVICDDRSPYNGLSVTDYRELANKWRLQRKEAEKQKLIRLQDEARLKGERIPTQLPARSPYKIAKDSLPPFPENAKNYLNDSSI
jgi:hypothetical protein